jgi:hypothetical protein
MNSGNHTRLCNAFPANRELAGKNRGFRLSRPILGAKFNRDSSHLSIQFPIARSKVKKRANQRNILEVHGCKRDFWVVTWSVSILRSISQRASAKVVSQPFDRDYR